MSKSIGIPYAVSGTFDGMETVGQRIKKRRIQLGISQAALARAIKIKPPSLADIESGKTKRAAGQTLINIARQLHTDPEYLLNGVNRPPSLHAPEDGRILVPVTSREELCLELFKKLTPQQQEVMLHDLRLAADANRVTERAKGSPVARHVSNVDMEVAYGVPKSHGEHPKARTNRRMS